MLSQFGTCACTSADGKQARVIWAHVSTNGNGVCGHIGAHWNIRTHGGWVGYAYVYVADGWA